MSVRTIFRILSANDWQTALSSGAFRGTAHDIRDGFLHFSTAAQVAETAARHYAGQLNLVLLYIDVGRLPHPLAWEPARNGDLFPHLYGFLPVSAVYRIEKLPLATDGRHVWPASLTGD